MCVCVWSTLWCAIYITQLTNSYIVSSPSAPPAVLLPFCGFVFFFAFLISRMSFWHLGRVSVGWGRGLCVLCLICHVGVFYVL